MLRKLLLTAVICFYSFILSGQQKAPLIVSNTSSPRIPYWLTTSYPNHLSSLNDSTKNKASTAAESSDEALLNYAVQSNISKLKKYQSSHAGSLFMQVDKAIYLHNEPILFTGYLLGPHKDQSHTLYVTLVDLSKQKVVASDRFIMAMGVGSGYLYIPDSLATGEYLLYAYTNEKLEGKIQEPFRQQISIRSEERDPFYISARVLQDSVTGLHDPLHLTCSITDALGNAAFGAEFHYTLLEDGMTLKAGKGKLNAIGEAHIDLPKQAGPGEHLVLLSEVRKDQLYKSFWTPIQIKSSRIQISYYPEGGRLIDNRLSEIGVTIRNQSGTGLATQGTLLEDDKAISSFQTDISGNGIISVAPHKNRKYTVQLLNLPQSVVQSDKFPSISTEGFSLEVLSGCAKDSFKIKLFTPESEKRAVLMVYTDNTILYTSKLNFHSNIGILNISAKDWPSGPATVAFFDKNDELVAERNIYHQGEPIYVSLTQDSTNYHKGSKVQLHIKVTNEKGEGIKALLSCATVLSNRMPASWLFDNIKASNTIQDSMMEASLLTTPSQEAPWNDVEHDTINSERTIHETDHGYVLYKSKRVRHKIDLLLANNTAYALTTDSAGNFEIPHDMLHASSDGKTTLTVIAKKNQEEYSIKLITTWDTLNDRLAELPYFPQTTTKDSLSVQEQERIKALKYKTLKEIVIKGGNRYSDISDEGVFKSTTCNDYVCYNDILNCPVHKFGRKPVEGERYRYHGLDVTYFGCAAPIVVPTFIKQLRPIHLTKDLFQVDSSDINFRKSELNSTVHWSPIISTNKRGEAILNFYTNDLSGQYFNTINGICDYGTLGNKLSFSVSE